MIAVANLDLTEAFPPLPAGHADALVAILALERVYQHGVAATAGTPRQVLRALEARHLTVSRVLGHRRYHWLTVLGAQLARAEEKRRTAWERAS